MVAFAAIAFTAAKPARANNAFPDEFSLHFPAGAPHRMFMGANFGLLVSEDDGLTWRYTCEPWIVSGSNAALAFANVSYYELTADGAVLADAYDIKNMTRSDDVACTWPSSGGSIVGQGVADFFADPNDATLVLGNVVTTSGSYIVASHDGGRTFDAPHLLDTPELLTGIEIARSKPGVAYATSFSSGSASVYASANSGTTWGPPTTFAIPSATEPRILAVDPADDQKIYLRIVGATSDEIRISADGGKTFQPVLTTGTPLSSFLRAGDGALYAGTRAGKLYVQPAGAAVFEPPRDSPHLRCLGQRRGTTRIYACSDMVVDGYSLASSDDGGKTFQPVMSFRDLLGPLTCAPVQTNCQAHWQRIQGVLFGAPDAGQADGGQPSSNPGGSHCGSVGAGGSALLVLLAFSLRRLRWT
jgi:hypothetical protein